MSKQSENMLQMIKEQIRSIDFESSNMDVGTVFKVGDGIAFVRGLDNVLAGEMLRFNDEVFGLALNLEENQVGVVLLGSDKLIKEGDPVYRTERIIEVGVGDGLLGRVVDSLGQPIDGYGDIEYEDTRPVERVAPGVMTRRSVYQPLMTKFLREAKNKEANIHFGHTMLLYQAQYAFEIWTGKKPEIDSLDDELKNILEG